MCDKLATKLTEMRKLYVLTTNNDEKIHNKLLPNIGIFCGS